MSDPVLTYDELNAWCTKLHEENIRLEIKLAELRKLLYVKELFEDEEGNLYCFPVNHKQKVAIKEVITLEELQSKGIKLKKENKK